MKSISAKALAERMGGEYFGNPTTVAGFATDDRMVELGQAFLAIHGARSDGHAFVPNAFAAGASVAVVERPVAGNHILVPNLVQALANLAASYRGEFEGPVIGITGSAGKTITKEFVAAALNVLGPVVKTQGNRNTEYTAPLLWPEIGADTTAVVVELSMRGRGQIAQLADFCRPTHSVITNIGWAHLEQLGSREAIAETKAEILQCLPEDGVAVLWKEDDFFDKLKQTAWPKSVATFGYSEGADCRIISYEPLNWQSCLIKGFYLNLPWEAELPVVGRHLALNAAAAITVSATAGVSPQEAADALLDAEIPPMRMQVLDRDGALIILDTYNASFPAMLAAIDTLAEMPCDGTRRAVVGEMKELGQHAEEAHAEVGRRLAERGIREVCFVGEPMIRFAAPEFAKTGRPYRTTNDIGEVRDFLGGVQPEDHVLVKGSRALELERALAPA